MSNSGNSGSRLEFKEPVNGENSSFRSKFFFPTATQADIVRAYQKDHFYIRFLNDQIFELVRNLFGPNFALKFQKETYSLSELIYFSLTTLMGD